MKNLNLKEYTTIKLIETKAYEIALIELKTGHYCVVYAQNDKVFRSQPTTDLATVMNTFDAKLQHLEGN